MITATEIYAAYPRKVARLAAIKAIDKALSMISAPALLERVQHYAQHCRGKEKKFIPHPATWFNQGRYFDIDDDPDAWPIGPEIPVGEAWALALDAVRTVGRHSPGSTKTPRDVLPAAVYDATRAVGWNKICDMTDRSRNDIKEQFRAAYERVGSTRHGRPGQAVDGTGIQSEDGTGERLRHG
jgi:hypothetical protein